MTEVTTPGAVIWHCPLPGCGIAHVEVPPGPEESEGALASVFGPGVFAATARAQRLAFTEEKLAAHMATHKIPEWAVALVRANSKLAAVREWGTANLPVLGVGELLEILDGPQ